MKGLMAVGTGVVLMAAVLAVEAGIPTDQIRGGTDRVLRLLQDPELRKPARADDRRRQLRAVVDEVFDWQETGKRALARQRAWGETWSSCYRFTIERESVDGRPCRYVVRRHPRDPASAGRPPAPA